MEAQQLTYARHSYGERFIDANDGRPQGAPRLPADRAPKVLGGTAIPADPERMPDDLTYDAAAQELRVGEGRISNVTPRMWSYSVSGVNVLGKWFSCRRQTRDRPVMGDRRVSALLDIQLDHWPAEYTRELVDMLNVLGLLIDLEPEQSELLAAIVPSYRVAGRSEPGGGGMCECGGDAFDIVKGASGHRHDQIVGGVVGERESPTVETVEGDQRTQCQPLVAVDQRMIACQGVQQRCRLLV